MADQHAVDNVEPHAPGELDEDTILQRRRHDMAVIDLQYLTNGEVGRVLKTAFSGQYPRSHAEADAVLANSGDEPFGLVGLETMAAGGVACTGGSGEDYAVPGYNALVLETTDPREFIGLFGELRRDPAQEHAIRQAGRLTAQHTVHAGHVRLLLHDRSTVGLGSHGSGISRTVHRVGPMPW